MHSSSITDSSKDWIINTTLSNENIKDYINDLYSDPCLSIMIPEDDGSKKRKKYYSEEQLFNAFRLGVRSMSNTEIGKKILREKYKKTMKSYSTLRNMDIGETKIFPYEIWNTLRSAASKLKSTYGCSFKVTKLGSTNEIGDIKVKRLS